MEDRLPIMGYNTTSVVLTSIKHDYMHADFLLIGLPISYWAGLWPNTVFVDCIVILGVFEQNLT